MTNTPISQLAPGAPVTDGNEFANVQVPGLGPVKTTAAQFKTYTSLSPLLVTPNLGTPSAGVLTNCTGLPLAAVAGLGTGVAAALAANVDAPGSVLINGGNAGTPSAINLTNATNLPTGAITPRGDAGQVLTSNGALIAPTWETLPVSPTYTQGSVPFANATGDLDQNNNNFFWDNGNLRLGIRTDAPAAALDVRADILINGILVGRGAGNIDTNTAFGSGNLAANTTGVDNTALGANALVTNINNDCNTAVGSNALRLSNSDFNTAVGFNAATSTSTGIANTAIGVASLGLNETGSNNVAIGRGSLGLNVAGSNNIGLGNQAGAILQNGSGNVYIGGYAGSTNSNDTVYISDGAGSLRVKISSTNDLLVGVPADRAGTISLANNATNSVVSLACNSATAADWTMTLPAAPGTAGQVLSTDGAGGTSWIGAGGTVAVGDITGLGTNVATALAVNVGTAGSFVVNGGVLGTPSSGSLASCTDLPIVAGTTGTLTSARGGTGLTTVGTNGQVLSSNGTNVVWSNSPANWPAFRAFQSVVQNAPGGAWTKILFQTEQYDTNNCYNPATSTFTPNVPGYYVFTAYVRSDSVSTSAVVTGVWKNNGFVQSGPTLITPTGGFVISSPIPMNGTTDFVDIRQYGDVSFTTRTGAELTNFGAFMVRPL